MRRRTSLAALLGVLVCVGAFGQSTHATARQAAHHGALQQQHRQTGGGTYVNSTGIRVRRPVRTDTGSPPAGATAQCRDGSYSFSLSHRGTCSHHGGVARWLGSGH